jgi:8-oxo-dGTP pyrophosphatase MutT (NUDIX family)
MREPIPTWFFALVVVRLGHRFLLVHERKHGQGWYLPAGRVEAGETIVEAAVRETMEEAGIPIVCEGILRVEHTPSATGESRVRVFVMARPADDTPPKSIPDMETLGAAWVSPEELSGFRLRGPEVADVLLHVSRGGMVAPLSLLESEGSPWSSSLPFDHFD